MVGFVHDGASVIYRATIIGLMIEILLLCIVPVRKVSARWISIYFLFLH